MPPFCASAVCVLPTFSYYNLCHILQPINLLVYKLSFCKVSTSSFSYSEEDWLQFSGFGYGRCIICTDHKMNHNWWLLTMYVFLLIWWQPVGPLTWLVNQGSFSCHIILYCSCTCQCWSTSNYITLINCCYSLRRFHITYVTDIPYYFISPMGSPPVWASVSSAFHLMIHLTRHIQYLQGHEADNKL